jgi:O-antigen ligase
MKNNKKIILLLFAFMFMLLLAAKGPILFLFLSIIAMYWKQIKFFKLKTFFIGLSSVILFVGISFATGSSIFGNLIGRLMFFSEGIEADQSSLGRLVLFGKALELIAESPILGVGIGGFSKAIGGEDGRLSPHNIFLELWVEVGILPLIILFALIIFLTVKYRKLLKVFPDYMGKSIISICLYMFFGLLVSSYLEDLRLTYFWIGVSIAYFALLYREKKYVRN